MTDFRSLWLAIDPTPTPPPAFEGDPNLVTPGVIGFIVTFLIAAVTILLILDMVRRIRRVRYREQAREVIAAEQAGEHPEQTGETPER